MMASQPVISPGSTRAGKVALGSLIVTLLLMAAKLVAALATGSLALLSEAANSALDAGTTAITLISVRIASRPPDKEHPYGHGKAENLSALIQTFILLALSMYIAVQAVNRLRTGSAEVEASWYAFAVVIASIVVDANRSLILSRVARQERSPALQADALNFRADLMSSGAVLAGLVLVRAGYPGIDALASLAIAGYVAFMSIRAARTSIDTLMDRAPEGSIERIFEVASQVEGVEEVRRVRMRYAGGEPQADVVIGISRRVPLERAHRLTEEVERVIRKLEPGADVVVHVEPTAGETAVAHQVQAIALRQPVAAETHNIIVTSHPEGHHVSLHVKFPGTMTLEQAHALADDLEGEILREVPDVARVDTHLEPLGERSSGKDVTGQHGQLAEWTRRLAQRQPEVQGCHELLISQTDDGLEIVIHCEAEPRLSVSAVHEAATRIEDATHVAWPKVSRVTVHFEPVNGGRAPGLE